MPLGPRKADIPRIQRTLSVYKVSSVITGTFLLLLCLMMVLRYGVKVDIELGGAYGLLALTPKELITGVNLSMFILIVHGWLYVLYLACDFLLWRYLRWSFGRFLVIALGGVIPFLSFFLERRVPRLVEERLRPLAESEAPSLVESRS
jgi:integral membrane protein